MAFSTEGYRLDLDFPAGREAFELSHLVDPVSGRGVTLSKLGLGCSQVGSLGHASTPAQWRAHMRRALDLGVTVFDTADIYGQGDSEREIGRVLSGRRDAAFVITKIGKRFSAAMSLARPLKPVLKPLLALKGARGAVRARREGVMRCDFTPAYLARALDASLSRLRFDHVDALLLHGPNAEVYRDPAVGETLAGFLKQGKALAVGASCEGMDDLLAALAMPGVSILQLPLDLIDEAARAGVGAVIAERGLIVLAREVIRARPDLAPAQAVAAAAAKPGVACVIAGTSRTDHLIDLVSACERSNAI
jgi:aryl-alcohol dehydrogenase-like predicted oxidoreductase